MDKSEFARRRNELMEMLGKGGIAIVPASPVCNRNRDVQYPYRPDSNFYYLTGFPEPEALAVLIPGRTQGQYLLFCRERDLEKETWHGARAGLEGACVGYGADDAFPITDIDDIVPGLLEGSQRLFYAMGCSQEFDGQVLDWLNLLRSRARKGVRMPSEIVVLDHVLRELRLFKSPEEIIATRKAAEISVQAHQRAMRYSRPGVQEYEVEAEIVHEFMRYGAHPAYPAIVAAGKNTCILHYTNKNAQLEDGDLLLVDAGAEFDYYAADISRTYPVNGRFSDAQKAIYELVLEAQQAAIAQIYPGSHWHAPHETAVRIITSGLKTLGLLKGKVKTLLKDAAYKRFCMHRTGHWLGMDVHDVGNYKTGMEWRVFEPDMLVTVEPGLYIPAAQKDVDKKWQNIGVRIEDNVLVTEDGCEVLT
ncbi:MAG: M24 family metallopeptidase, partial [Gammaproteobacteria bacterium]|nr:M24 family metallopeptidase [Gammaproteobacteria bacterium]